MSSDRTEVKCPLCSKELLPTSVQVATDAWSKKKVSFSFMCMDCSVDMDGKILRRFMTKYGVGVEQSLPDWWR